MLRIEATRFNQQVVLAIAGMRHDLQRLELIKIHSVIMPMPDYNSMPLKFQSAPSAKAYAFSVWGEV